MAEEGNAYVIALENLQEYENDLRDIFTSIAGDSDQIGLDSIPDLLNSVGSMLGLDVENAQTFFSWDNTELPENYDLNALDFIQFYELLGLWLHKESLTYPVTGRTGGNEPEFSVALSKNNITSRSSPGVEANMALMKELVKQNQDKYEALFQEHIPEEGQERITVEACYDFLQECLYSSQIELKEKVKSIKDSYKNLESTQKFFEIAEKYFLDELKEDPENFDINEQVLSFKDCFEILDYWLRNDENVVLIDKRRKDRSSGGGITAALKETIEKYEKMIEDAKDETEREVLETTIQTLKAQLRDLETGGMGRRSKSVKDGLEYHKREERRLKALKEIFEVYCLLQLNLGKMGTFEKYNRVSNTITLGTFKVILKDFRLKINHLKVVELFNKTTMTDENMSFDEFIEFLSKVALRVEIVTEERVHQPNPEIRKEYKPDCYKRDNTYKIFKEKEAQKKQVFATLKRRERDALLKDQVKRDADKLEEIWDHMGLYDGTYKNWISLVRVPFQIKDKESVRIKPESINYKFKPKTGDSLEDIQRRNEMRKLVKDLKTVEKSFISNFKATSSHSAIRTELSISRPSKEDSYSQQKSRNKKSAPNIKKLTMKGVENFHDEDLMKIDDKFNPQELIQENDEEDDMYLAEYNIQERRIVVKPDTGFDMKKYDNYGRLKKASKGFAVNGKYGHKNQESRSNLLDGDGAYPGNYSQYESRNVYTNPKGTPVASYNNLGPSSGKYTTKGANSIYRPTQNDYSTNMNMPTRNSGGYSNYDSGVNHTHDYPRNTYNYEYSSGNAPYVSSNGYIPTRNQGYQQTQNRIDRIERDAYMKQQQMMDNIMSIQQQQLQKGLKTVRK